MKQRIMVIFRCTAKRIAMTISVMLILYLTFAAAGVKAVYSQQEKDTPVQSVYMDVGNAVGSDNDNYTAVKDSNRENSYGRYFGGIILQPQQNVGVIYDTDCGVTLSGCKVRQNIFYCRQQSDDEEAPL